MGFGRPGNRRSDLRCAVGLGRCDLRRGLRLADAGTYGVVSHLTSSQAARINSGPGPVTAPEIAPSRADWALALFNRSVLKQAKYRQIVARMDDPAGKRGLDIGA